MIFQGVYEILETYMYILTSLDNIIKFFKFKEKDR